MRSGDFYFWTADEWVGMVSGQRAGYYTRMFCDKMEEKMKIKKKVFRILVFVSVCLISANSFASGGHGHEKQKKVGILLVAFGSSETSAQVSFENIEKKVREVYPDIPVRWAYTSRIIRKKLAKQGKNLDSTAVALAKMMDEDFTHVAVQSLHTIRGEEYTDLVATVAGFSHMPEGMSIIVGNPLLSSQEDMEKAAAAIIRNIPKNRKKTEAVILMGHGTLHPANAFYAALMFHLQKQDTGIFVGTVEGSPEINEIKAMLEKNKIKKAYLIPFMSVAGDHAKNDMAGDEEDSWKSILTRAGIQCDVILKGTAEYDNMVDIWVSHLEKVMAHF